MSEIEKIAREALEELSEKDHKLANAYNIILSAIYRAKETMKKCSACNGDMVCQLCRRKHDGLFKIKPEELAKLDSFHEISKLKQDNARLREALEPVAEWWKENKKADQTRGLWLPPVEWAAVMSSAAKALEDKDDV